MTETKLMQHHLEWLGHLDRMQDHRCWRLHQTQPSGNPRRWRDLGEKDLKAVQTGTV